MAWAGGYVSNPSNSANVSTSGENLEGGPSLGPGGSEPTESGHWPSLVAPCTGLEVYPSRTQLPGLLPQPILAGVLGGLCFLGVAILVSILAACLTSRRRAARRRHRKCLRQGRASPHPSLQPEEGPPCSISILHPALPALFPASWGWAPAAGCGSVPGALEALAGLCHLRFSCPYRSTSYLLSSPVVSSSVSPFSFWASCLPTVCPYSQLPFLHLGV